MSERLAQRFADLRGKSRAGLACFMTAGYPDWETSRALARALPAAGADVIEIGAPFSDPIADGPVIQAASAAALASGRGGWADVLTLAEDIRAVSADTPIVVMGYANPLYARGLDAAAADYARAGVDAAIVVDVPMEEDAPLRAALGARGLALASLLAPTTGEARKAKMLERAQGFVYCVAVLGVTGGREAEPAQLAPWLDDIRARSRVPVAVGFGVRRAEQARALGAMCDLVVVGSALVESVGAGGVAAAIAKTQELAGALQ